MAPNNRSLYYQGNRKLKNSDISIDFSLEEAVEISKCQEDPMYFFENYIKIVSLDRGIINFKPHQFQKDMVDLSIKNRFVICKWPRQQGKTTTVAALLLWYVLFNDNYSIALLAHKAEQAREILERIQLAYENLPFWLQQGIIEWNKGNIKLENGSEIKAFATSEGGVRGQSYNFVYLDEFAHIELNLQESFMTSTYPVISSGKDTKIIITSTPRGFELFYKIWNDAKNGRNNFKTHEAEWHQMPGRDEAWKEETIRNTSQRQFDQEFNTEFLGSTNTLIDPNKLRTMTYFEPLFEQTDLTVFRTPKEGHVYVCTVDTSEGLNLDYHAFAIIDVTNVPYEVVAVFHSNTLPPILLPNVIYNTCKIYNDALVLIEIQTNGQLVANILYQDLEYENILMTVQKGKFGQRLSAGFQGTKMKMGVQMSKQVKRIGCSNLKALIENDKLIINDFRILNELMNFVVDKQSFAAAEGFNDDITMTLVIFGWMASQELFKDITDSRIREHLLLANIDAVEQDVTPFGIIDDGQLLDYDDGWVPVER